MRILFTFLLLIPMVAKAELFWNDPSIDETRVLGAKEWNDSEKDYKDNAICRYYDDEEEKYYAGKEVAHQCNYGLGGKAEKKDDYNILFAENGEEDYRWINGDNFLKKLGGNPEYLFNATKDENPDSPLYICRTIHTSSTVSYSRDRYRGLHAGMFIPGKIDGEGNIIDGKCVYAFGDGGYSKHSDRLDALKYDVLALPKKDQN